jgi:hypothetical protein
MENEGYDVYTGHGLLIMPELVVESQDDVMKVRIGSTQASFNGDPVTLPIAPILVNNSTMVGLRGIMEQFGLQTTWDNTLKEVTITGKRRS